MPRRPSARRPNATAAYVLSGLALAALLVSVLRPAAWASLPDFDKAYYAAGRKALTAPATLYDAPVVDFVNVPLVALLFAPFAWLGEPRARLAFALLGALAVILAVASLRRAHEPGAVALGRGGGAARALRTACTTASSSGT